MAWDGTGCDGIHFKLTAWMSTSINSASAVSFSKWPARELSFISTNRQRAKRRHGIVGVSTEEHKYGWLHLAGTDRQREGGVEANMGASVRMKCQKQDTTNPSKKHLLHSRVLAGYRCRQQYGTKFLAKWKYSTLSMLMLPQCIPQTT